MELFGALGCFFLLWLLNRCEKISINTDAKKIKKMYDKYGPYWDYDEKVRARKEKYDWAREKYGGEWYRHMND
jgi:hypothetical protein